MMTNDGFNYDVAGLFFFATLFELTFNSAKLILYQDFIMCIVQFKDKYYHFPDIRLSEGFFSNLRSPLAQKHSGFCNMWEIVKLVTLSHDFC